MGVHPHVIVYLFRSVSKTLNRRQQRAMFAKKGGCVSHAKVREAVQDTKQKFKKNEVLETKQELHEIKKIEKDVHALKKEIKD